MLGNLLGTDNHSIFADIILDACIYGWLKKWKESALIAVVYK